METVQVEMQGQLGRLGGAQAEASDEGSVQNLGREKHVSIQQGCVPTSSNQNGSKAGTSSFPPSLHVHSF